jgi:hypothetical protein
MMRPMALLPDGWLARLRDLNARAAARRTPAWSLGFGVLFLAAALVWARLPHLRLGGRLLWAGLLLALAIHDFARGVQARARVRGAPTGGWIPLTVGFGVLGGAAVVGLALLGR